jgi:hypothetical protein
MKTTVKPSASKWITAAKQKIETGLSMVTRWFNESMAYPNPFAPNQKELEQARLMGMYLAQANDRRLPPFQRSVSRGRIHGRSSYIRQRASRFSNQPQ